MPDLSDPIAAAGALGRVFAHTAFDVGALSGIIHTAEAMVDGAAPPAPGFLALVDAFVEGIRWSANDTLDVCLFLTDADDA